MSLVSWFIVQDDPVEAKSAESAARANYRPRRTRIGGGNPAGPLPIAVKRGYSLIDNYRESSLMLISQ